MRVTYNHRINLIAFCFTYDPVSDHTSIVDFGRVSTFTRICGFTLSTKCVYFARELENLLQFSEILWPQQVGMFINVSRNSCCWQTTGLTKMFAALVRCMTLLLLLLSVAELLPRTCATVGGGNEKPIRNALLILGESFL